MPKFTDHTERITYTFTRIC